MDRPNPETPGRVPASDPIPRPQVPRMPSPPVVAPRPSSPHSAAPGGSVVSGAFSMDDFRQAPAAAHTPLPDAPDPAYRKPPQSEAARAEASTAAASADEAPEGPRDVRSRPLLFGPEPEPAKPSPWIGGSEVVQKYGVWILVALVAVLTTILMIPRSKEDSVRAIQKDAAAYDGRTVTVRGRAGDAYDIAGGHVYYLFQGRDTIVVFTRGTPPQRKKEVIVTATVSTGYMDGQPRLALFEIPSGS